MAFPFSASYRSNFPKVVVLKEKEKVQTAIFDNYSQLVDKEVKELADNEEHIQIDAGVVEKIKSYDYSMFFEHANIYLLLAAFSDDETEAKIKSFLVSKYKNGLSLEKMDIEIEIYRKKIDLIEGDNNFINYYVVLDHD